MSKQLSFTILRFDSLPSTNTEAARQAVRGAPEGLCVVAREQTAGRGRRERVWASPKDAGLYFSVVLRPDRLEARLWPLVSLAAALAAHDALREACALGADIKWPNDILFGGRKLCGILAETVETPPPLGRALVVGVGINLSEHAYPEELRATATSVEGATGRVPDRERLLEALTRALARRYRELLGAGGAGSTIEEWAARSSYAEGKRVRVATADDETLEGTTRGLEPDGALRIEARDGEVHIIHTGDVMTLRQAEGG